MRLAWRRAGGSPATMRGMNRTQPDERQHRFPAARIISRLINALSTRVPPIRHLVEERDCFRAECELLKRERDELAASLNTVRFVPPGHFYSPIPALDEVARDEERIFRVPDVIPGVDLNTSGQLRLLDEFAQYYAELPFRAEKIPERRYHFENPNYSYSDGICLYSMIRHAKPKRIVEVGSGYSSCATLDTNEIFFENEILCAFIEPYPDLLFSLLRQGDADRIEVLRCPLQDVDLVRFEELQDSDILFIDSTHISKVGSDVNYLMFEILPRLRSGVYIHVHDIFYPFEYPRSWVFEGRAWNEAYLLRAFLQYNDAFAVVFFNTYLELFFADRVRQAMPLCLKNPGGSLWLRRK